MDRGAWWATVHVVAKSQTQLKGLHACVLSRFSRVGLFATLWTVARQSPLSMGFSREEYYNGLPSPPPRDRPTND